MMTKSIALIAGVVAFGLVVGCAPEAMPDTPELRLEKARALAALEAGDGGGYEETLDLGASLATDSTVDALVLELERELTDEEEAEVRGVMRDALAEALPAEEWQRAAAEIYAEHFSPAELDAAIEFYTSPVGAKILGVQSTLDRQMGDAVDAIVEQRLEEFIGLVDLGLAELFPELDQGGEG
jgi:hypothetical protein